VNDESDAALGADGDALDADDDAAIRALIDAQTAAWNAGDGRGYAADFAPSGTFVNVVGQRHVGREAFAQRHVEILRGFFRGSVLVPDVRRLRRLADGAALAEIDVDVRGAPAMPPGVAAFHGVLRTRLLQVYARRDGRWWIEAHHNVDLKPAAFPVTAGA
jgi:uncharacterized protein (TIGR02246 family)